VHAFCAPYFFGPLAVGAFPPLLLRPHPGSIFPHRPSHLRQSSTVHGGDLLGVKRICRTWLIPSTKLISGFQLSRHIDGPRGFGRGHLCGAKRVASRPTYSCKFCPHLYLAPKDYTVCVCVWARLCVFACARVCVCALLYLSVSMPLCACVRVCVRTECRFACQHLQLEVAAHRTLIARVLQQVMVPVAYDRETFITFQAQHQQKLRAGITYRARHATNDM